MFASAAFKKRRMSGHQPDLLRLLQQRIGRRAVPEIKKAFNFRVVHGEVMRIGCYDSADGGYFRAHRDNTTPYTAHRQFAMSVNLNTGEYEGGECISGMAANSTAPPAGRSSFLLDPA
jgi:hypothetical protein